MPFFLFSYLISSSEPINVISTTYQPTNQLINDITTQPLNVEAKNNTMPEQNTKNNADTDIPVPTFANYS